MLSQEAARSPRSLLLFAGLRVCGHRRKDTPDGGALRVFGGVSTARLEHRFICEATLGALQCALEMPREDVGHG